MFRNICSCHDWGTPGVEWVGERHAVQYPTVPKLAPHKERLVPDDSSTEGTDAVLIIWEEKNESDCCSQ